MSESEANESAQSVHDTEPADHHEVSIVIIGMVGWALALIVLVVFFRPDLQRHHATWWYWSCGLGLVLGLYGLRFALRRRGGFRQS